MTLSPSPGRGGLEILGPSAEAHLFLDHDVSSSQGLHPTDPVSLVVTPVSSQTSTAISCKYTRHPVSPSGE